MDLGETYQKDVSHRVSERRRQIALWAGVSGLVVNFFVCLVYTISGEASAIM